MWSGKRGEGGGMLSMWNGREGRRINTVWRVGEREGMQSVEAGTIHNGFLVGKGLMDIPSFHSLAAVLLTK